MLREITTGDKDGDIEQGHLEAVTSRPDPHEDKTK
jgi:hypothetical protein